MSYFDLIIAADWAREAGNRVCYLADLNERCIQHLELTKPTLATLLAHIQDSYPGRKTLLTFDLAIGAPRAFFERAVAKVEQSRRSHFLQWVLTQQVDAPFWKETNDYELWSVERPFIAVPPGEGSLERFCEAAGVPLKRKVDLHFGGKSPFIVNGIPGTVGSGTRSFWKELIDEYHSNRTFGVYPFDGDLAMLSETYPIVVAENYPAISYTAVFEEQLPAARCRLSKTKSEVRERAIQELEKLSWWRDLEITLPDLANAVESEDHFDALMVVLSHMRIQLSGQSLFHPNLIDTFAEGAIAGSSAILIDQKSKSLDSRWKLTTTKSTTKSRSEKDKTCFYRCPIEGCEKKFQGTRGGWDGHVGSLRMHPDWHPDVTDEKERREIFRREFPNWF